MQHSLSSTPSWRNMLSRQFRHLCSSRQSWIRCLSFSSFTSYRRTSEVRQRGIFPCCRSLYLTFFSLFPLYFNFMQKWWLAHDTWLTVVLSFDCCHRRSRLTVIALLATLGYQPAFVDHLCACRFAVVILSICPSSLFLKLLAQDTALPIL